MTKQEKNQNFSFIKSTLLSPTKFFEKNDKHTLKDKACYSHDYTKYGYMETWETVLEKVNNVPKDNMFFNELITSEHKVKPYLDIEWYKEDFPTYDPDDVKRAIKEHVTYIFKEFHEIELNHDNFRIASCHRQTNKGYKYSFHLIIVTLNPMYVYSSTLTACFLANKLREELDLDGKYSSSLIDKNVYKSKQNMRLISQYKRGDGENPFTKQNPSDNDLDYIITNINRKHIIIPVEEQADKFIEIDNFKSVEYDDKVKNFIIEKVKLLHPTASLLDIDSNNFMQFNYSNRNEPCFCHESEKVYHDKIGFFVYVNENNLVCAGCHSNNCLTEENKKIIIPITNISTLILENIPRNLPISVDNDFSYIEISKFKDYMENNIVGLSELLGDMFLLPSPRVIVIGSQRRTSRECYIWNGDYWEQDITDSLRSKSVFCLLKLLRQTRELLTSKFDSNETFSKSYKTTVELMDKRIATLTEGGRAVDNMLKFFNHNAAWSPDAFENTKDKNFYYLPCKNGQVCLRDGVVTKRVPEDYVTKIIGTEYHPDADSSDFDNFIREILKNVDGTLNLEKYNFFRWIIGQALTRDPKKVFVILYGPRAYNGKSTFVSVLQSVLEWMTNEVDSSVILESGPRSKGAHSSELMAIKDLCLAFTSETNTAASIDAAEVKRITGGDLITSRQIYGEQTTFQSRCIPVVCTNKVINMDLTDRAVSERTVIFSFKLSFVNDPKEPHERKNDVTLVDKLKSNKEGVLKWLVDSGIYYCQNMGMVYPAFVKEEQKDYMKKMDDYIDFLDTNFVQYNPDYPEFLKHTIPFQDVIDLFKNYLSENCKKIPMKDIREKFNKIIKIENQTCIGLRYIN